MIHRVFSDNNSFNEVNFTAGLNIVLGVKNETSNDQDTMNGVGKTTLLEIIDFCLGSNIDKNSYLKKINEIENWMFSIDIDLFDSRYVISRSIKNQNKIFVDGDLEKLPKLENEGNKYYFKLKDWRKFLGLHLFNIEDDLSKFSPTFRSIISYFIRKNPQSYDSPFEHHKKQMMWDVQANTAFLIGLNWRHPCDFQVIRDNIKNVKKDLKEFDKSTIGEMETKKINLENDLAIKSERLSTFKVHENYNEIENRANELSKDLSNLSNTNMVLKRKLKTYADSISTEVPPTNDSLNRLYEEIEDIFTVESKKTLSDVRLFHKNLIKNRKSFLNVEIKEIEKKIEDNEKLINIKGDERSKLLEILDSHNALDEFRLLQEEIFDEKIKVNELKNYIDRFHKIKEMEKELNYEKNILKEKNERDYEVQRPSWEESIRLFNENTKYLYGLNGELIINLKEAYDFKINFPKGDSRGVSKMEIFCYDLMLLESNSKDKNIDFLIHDSEIFSDVDSRQVAKALELAKNKCGDELQYIITLNSDELEKIKLELSNNFDVDDYIKLKLLDNDDKKHLLGFVFD